jgi:hypothetical protein
MPYRLSTYRLSITWIGLLLSLGNAQATTRTWPSAVAPCNSTLQACVDGSAATDTVLVAQSSVIDESVAINKPFSLLAARGYRPVLAVDRVISGNVNAPGTWSWTVEGFELRRGFISLSVNGGDTALVFIRHNRILQETSGAAEISLFKSSSITTTLNYNLSQNELSYFWNTFDGALRAAMQVLDGGTGSSTAIRRSASWSTHRIVHTASRYWAIKYWAGARAASIYARAA